MQHMDRPQDLDGAQLENAAATVIGQIVFVLSRLEFNLGLYLRNAIGATDANLVSPLIARLSFKNKIDALREVIECKFAADASCLDEFRHWHVAADAFRSKRNSFVHGSWGMYRHGQQVINVSPGLPGSRPRKEIRYTLAELDAELAEAKSLASSFISWSDKWPG